MTRTTQLICIWSGIAMFPLFFIGMGPLAGFIPPPSPNADAATIAAMYAEHRNQFRIGIVIMTASAALLCPFFAVITVQIWRIEGRVSALAICQAIAGACSVLEFIFPGMIWQAAAFRADRAPSEVQLLNDLGWLPFMGITGTFLVQLLCITIAIFGDRRAEPVWPRWLGYLNVWVAAGICPGTFVVFFKTGPLAWNGVLAWWCVVAVFFIWMVSMTWAMHRAVTRGVAFGDQPANLSDRPGAVPRP